MNQLEELVIETDKTNGCLPADRLRSIIERIEHKEEEKKNIQSDIKDIYAEAKSVGFDVNIIRQVIKLRKMDSADRDNQEALLDLYCKALGL